jgi:GAF domain-containing protein
MADNELKRLLENLFSDIPVEAGGEETPPEAAVEAARIGTPAFSESPPPATAEVRAEPSDGTVPEQVRRRALQLQTAAEISKAASSILDLDELITEAVELIRDRFELYYTGLFLLDKEGQYAVLQAGTGEAGLQMVQEGHRLEVGGGSMVGQCVATAKARIALDAGKEAVRHLNPLLAETRSEMALPLVSRGQVIGAMTIQSTEPGAFSEDDITALQTMADQLANAIENARLFQQRERRLIELSIVNEIGQALSTSMDLEELLATVHQQVSRLFDTTNFYIATYHEGSGEWTSDFHLEGGRRQPTARYGIEAGLTGHIIRNREPILFRSTDDNLAFNEVHGVEVIGELARSWLGVPLVAADKIVGAMAIQNYEHERLYGEEELALFSTVGAQVANALENLRLLEETQRRVQELTMLSDVSDALARAPLQSKELAAVIAHQLVKVLPFPEASVSILDARGSVMLVVADVFADPTEEEARMKQPQLTFLLADYPATARVMETLQALVVHASDPEADPAELAYMRENDVATLVILPLTVSGQAFGVVELEAWDSERHFTTEELRVATTLCNQAAVALENARFFEETQARARRERILREITTRVRGSTDPDTIMRTAVRELGTTLGRPAFVRLSSPAGDLHAPGRPPGRHDGNGQATPEGGE